MTYAFILFAIGFTIAGVMGLVHHDYGGVPLLLIGLVIIGLIARRTWPGRTTGGEGGE